MSGWVRDTETQSGRERVGTDLFLLNSSRFNQQIIDLIKWHPLLGQEPARGMRISQAKIKIRSHALKKGKNKTKTKTQSRAFHQTSALAPVTPLSACRLCGLAVHRWSGSHLEAEVIPHSLPSHQKQNTGRDGKTRPRSWATVQNTQCRESGQKKAEAPEPEEARPPHHK